MKTYCIIITFIMAWSTLANAQKPFRPFTKELAVTIDNDYPFMTDQYYTAGQDLYYRFLIDPKQKIFHKDDSSKTILSLHYGNKVFTPLNLDTKDTREMDRPYCGWNFISMDVQNFRRKNGGNFLSLQIGVVGKESGMGQIQEWWHEAIKLYSLAGWDTQIRNEVVVNTAFTHTEEFPITRGMEIISASGATLGTGSNKISQEFTLRLFRFNPISESSFLGAKLSQRKTRREFFLFTSFGGDYVISNIFIEGSLFKDHPSPFTTSVNPFLFTSKVGIQYASDRISAGLAVVHLSKETRFVEVHNYASATLAYRF